MHGISKSLKNNVSLCYATRIAQILSLLILAYGPFRRWFRTRPAAIALYLQSKEHLKMSGAPAVFSEAVVTGCLGDDDLARRLVER